MSGSAINNVSFFKGPRKVQVTVKNVKNRFYLRVGNTFLEDVNILFKKFFLFKQSLFPISNFPNTVSIIQVKTISKISEENFFDMEEIGDISDVEMFWIRYMTSQ